MHRWDDVTVYKILMWGKFKKVILFRQTRELLDAKGINALEFVQDNAGPSYCFAYIDWDADGWVYMPAGFAQLERGRRWLYFQTFIKLNKLAWKYNPKWVREHELQYRTMRQVIVAIIKGATQ